MRPLRHLHKREEIIDVAREYLSRHGLTFIDGKVFARLLELMRRFDRTEWNNVIELALQQNPHWLTK